MSNLTPAERSAQASAQRRNRDDGTTGNGGAWSAAKKRENGKLQPNRTDWGILGVRKGTWTQWGEAQYVTEIAPGIAVFGTAGHGGVKLSAARNRLVHPLVRQAGGWYDEDDHAVIVQWTFPEETCPLVSRGYTHDVDLDDHITATEKVFIDHFPDEYEQMTGEVLLPGQSSTRDSAVWEEDHKDRFAVRSALTDPDDPDFAIIHARRADTGVTKKFRVPNDEYRAGNGVEAAVGGRFIVDESKYPEFVEPVATRLASASSPVASAADLDHLFGRDITPGR